MEQYVGLDVSQEQTSVCVVGGGGRVIWQGKCASTPEAIAATIRTRAPEAARIGLESGPLSAWHWHGPRKAGLLVVCLDAGWPRRCSRLGKASASKSRCSAAGSWPWPGRTRRCGG